MFSSSLRRQSPALLRASARALISTPSSKIAIVRPAAPSVLKSSGAQRRFFAVSTYLRDEAFNAATQEVVDSDPPAGEYHFSGHGQDHHFGKNEEITKFQQLADRGIVDKSIINTITKGLGYEEMTKVQRKTIMETVNGDNV
jgi:ATP-dependent RNA helicase MSS116